MIETVSPRTGRREVRIYVGEIYASAQPAIIRTLLGSCVAACLWDPETQIGGMNHFMLPRTGDGVTEDSPRFGVHAMDVLIGAIMKAGGDRRRFRAKIFGGGHVLDLRDSQESVPRQNVDFIREFCRDEGFAIVAEDLGGQESRHVVFDTQAGKAWVKRVRSLGARAEALRREHELRATPPAPAYGEVTLF
jgi:chemotaxis receptor (MCP) glutamine deamidase CheD